MKWIVCMSILPCVFGQPSLRIDGPIWTRPLPQSPKIPESKFGVDFATAPATNAEGETIALMAALRVPARYAAMYGGRIAGAMQVVAIDAVTGAVFSRPAEDSGAIPLSSVMDPNPDASALSRAPRDMTTWVNVDLRNHLELPSARSDYFVFLWLDEFTSPVRRITLPGPTRPPTSPDVPLLDVQWVRGPVENRLCLRKRSGPMVEGTVNSQPTPAPLILLAIDFETRVLSAARITTPRGSNTHFEFHPKALSGISPRHRFYLLASHGPALSNVLNYENGPPQHR